MYKDNEIGLEFFNKYNELIVLLKQKNAASSKLRDLEKLLQYFDNNYDNFNDDEKKLFKNILMISNGIINNVKNHYSYIEERKNNCKSLIQSIENKQKEPIK